MAKIDFTRAAAVDHLEANFVASAGVTAKKCVVVTTGMKVRDMCDVAWSTFIGIALESGAKNDTVRVCLCGKVTGISHEAISVGDKVTYRYDNGKIMVSPIGHYHDILSIDPTQQHLPDLHFRTVDGYGTPQNMVFDIWSGWGGSFPMRSSVAMYPDYYIGRAMTATTGADEDVIISLQKVMV